MHQTHRYAAACPALTLMILLLTVSGSEMTWGRSLNMYIWNLCDIQVLQFLQTIIFIKRNHKNNPTMLNKEENDIYEQICGTCNKHNVDKHNKILTKEQIGSKI